MPPDNIGFVVLTHDDSSSPRLFRDVVDAVNSPERVVLIVNGSAGVERQHADGPTVIFTGRNDGYAAGMNIGIRHHLDRGRDAVLLLTHDVVLSDNTIPLLVSAAATERDFGILGPRIVWGAQREPFSLGGIHDERGLATHRKTADPDSSGIAECDWVDGAAMLVRREVFEQIGFLDEQFFLYFEETEFCLRARRAGWKIGVVTDAEIEQEPGLARRPQAYTYLLARNGLEYARRKDGVRGISTALRSHVAESVHAARVLASRRTGVDARRDQGRLLLARWRGVFDFVRHRWGKPPASITRRSDVV